MSLNYSSNSFVAILELTQIYLYRFVGPIFTIIGIISCILSLMVFTRKNLRKSTCSIYYIALNIASLLFIILSLLSYTLEIGYKINPALHSLFYCRFRQYFAFLFDTLCPVYLLYASIDHVLVTSRNVRIRQKSTHRFAYIVIGISTLIFLLVLIHVVFFTNILQITSDHLCCYIESGWYLTAISYISLVKEIIVPSSLALFGFWSLKNIQTTHHIIFAPVSSGTAHIVLHKSRNRQFVLILLIDIIVYIIFNFLMPISLFYDQITEYAGRSTEQKYIALLIRNIAIFSVHIPFCISCYTHLFVSKTFRNEVKNVLAGK